MGDTTQPARHAQNLTDFDVDEAPTSMVWQRHTSCYHRPIATSPFSARLDANLVARLKRLSAIERIPTSQLAERYLEEGVRASEIPGITFRPGPTGRRAGLIGGPDVWEIVRDIRAARAVNAHDAVATVVASTDLSEDQVRTALAYYAAYPDEIEERIEVADELEARLVEAAGAGR